MIALLAFAAQISALGAEVAVLRNGRSISFVRKEELGNTTRLFTAEGYVDILTEQIDSFTTEETPPAPPQEPLAQQPQAAIAQAASNSPSSQQVATNDKGTVNLEQVVREASVRRQLDPDFVNSVIKAESNFKARAVSPKGAQGLMQLMPGTAAQLGVNDPFDPKANVEAGTTYLSQLLDLYHDDPVMALAAYNAGPERVQRYHGVPPYRETHAYIARIVRDFNARKMAQKAGQAQASAKKSTPAAVSHKAANSRKTTPKKKSVQQAAVTKPPTTGTN